jgi:uncharacterized phage protein gp47/JayE
MSYDPRTTSLILREMAARVVARGGADDVAEGSVLAHLLYCWAEELGGLEHRLARIRNAFYLDGASGTDLDDRVADLPPSGIVRLTASAGSGGALALTRVDTVGALTVLAGATYGRTDDSSLVYRQLADAVFADGVDTALNVAVVCLTPGVAGNAAAGQINKIINAVGATGAIGRTAITNGRDAEGDEALRIRARSYLSSLTGSTPAALEYLGLSFTAADGSRAAFARIFEDPDTVGLCELLLDDGSGLVGYRRPGALATGTVPDGGPPVLWHEAPAVEPVTRIEANIGGLNRDLLAAEYTSIPERGLVYVEDGVFAPGDTWQIKAYEVWTGLPAELQALIEGDPSDPLNAPGYRAAGVRVRVTAPSVFDIALSVNVVPVSGRDWDAVTADVKTAVIEYMATLGPGEPLFIARLIDRVMDNGDVLTVRFFQGADAATPANDVIPPSARHVLRTDDGRITVVPLPQEV